MKPIFIGIAGPSTSGKTTIAKKLENLLSDSMVITLDDYWKDSSGFKRKQGYKNWELPENIDFDLLLANLEDLKKGKETSIPICEKFKFKEYKKIKPKKFIILEGFLLFFDKKIREMFDLKIYLDLSEEEIINRRITRSRSEKPEREFYYRNVVVEEHKKYGEPTKKYSDLIIDGKGEIKESLKNILEKLKEYK